MSSARSPPGPRPRPLEPGMMGPSLICESEDRDSVHVGHPASQHLAIIRESNDQTSIRGREIYSLCCFVKYFNRQTESLKDQRSTLISLCWVYFWISKECISFIHSLIYQPKKYFYRKSQGYFLFVILLSIVRILHCFLLSCPVRHRADKYPRLRLITILILCLIWSSICHRTEIMCTGCVSYDSWLLYCLSNCQNKKRPK